MKENLIDKIKASEHITLKEWQTVFDAITNAMRAETAYTKKSVDAALSLFELYFPDRHFSIIDQDADKNWTVTVETEDFRMVTHTHRHFSVAIMLVILDMIG